MSNFVVEYCALKACQHWRIGNNCTKHNKSIADQLEYVINLHNSDVCEVRRQANLYRLDNLLEDTNE